MLLCCVVLGFLFVCFLLLIWESHIKKPVCSPSPWSPTPQKKEWKKKKFKSILCCPYAYRSMVKLLGAISPREAVFLHHPEAIYCGEPCGSWGQTALLHLLHGWRHWAVAGNNQGQLSHTHTPPPLPARMGQLTQAGSFQQF